MQMYNINPSLIQGTDRNLYDFDICITLQYEKKKNDFISVDQQITNYTVYVQKVFKK